MVTRHLVPGSVPVSNRELIAGLLDGVLDPGLGLWNVWKIQGDQCRGDKAFGPAVVSRKSGGKFQPVGAWSHCRGELGGIVAYFVPGEFHSVLLKLLLLLIRQETKRGDDVVFVEQFIDAAFLPEDVLSGPAEN